MYDELRFVTDKVIQSAGQLVGQSREARQVLTTNRMKSVVLLVLSVLPAAIAGGARQTPSMQLRLLDLDGRQIDPLRNDNAKATVFLFIRTDCPISNRYAPEVQRLYERFAHSGVNFWLVYPDRDESVEAITRHVKEYGYRLSVLRDPQHALVKLAEVEVTPEAAVFIHGRNMIYRGRIDDRFVAFGKMRPAPTTHDLEAILEAILRDEPVTKRTTPAIGCYISDLQ